jgi:hypothetical protein
MTMDMDTTILTTIAMLNGISSYDSSIFSRFSSHLISLHVTRATPPLKREGENSMALVPSEDSIRVAYVKADSITLLSFTSYTISSLNDCSRCFGTI